MAVKPGERPHRVFLQNPTTQVSDGEGGYVNTWTDLNPPRINVSIETATQQALQRLAASAAVIASATHIIRAPYHDGIQTDTRILFGARQFNVSAVVDPDETKRELAIVAEERVG